MTHLIDTQKDNIMTISIKAYTNQINKAFAARASYEADKNSDNDSIQKTIADMSKHFANEAIVKAFIAANVDAEFINIQERSTNRFNVYAAQKVLNIVKASASAASLNHYTKAILATASAMQSNDDTINHKDAVSACSLSCKSNDAKREKLIVKYQKHVAANTASTQSSSSINALQACKVLIESRDSSNAICYKIADTKFAKSLVELASA